MMDMNEFIERAQLIPFEEKGRSYDGADCWGLVWLFYRDVLGVSMPSLAEEYNSTRNLLETSALILSRRYDFHEQVDVPQAKDIVIIYRNGYPAHVGIMLDSRRMLHQEYGCNAVIEYVDRPPWRGQHYDKIEGFYRYAG